MAPLADGGHPVDGELIALVHDQPVADRARIAAHVGRCASCTDRIAALGRDDSLVDGLLAVLDHEMPVRRPAGPFIRPRQSGWRRVAVGAAITAVAAAAAAALPFTPVHRWLTSPGPKPHVSLTQAAAPVHPSAVDLAGVTLPHPTDVVVVLRYAQRSGVIDVLWTADSDAAVANRGGTAAYDVSDQRVLVTNTAPVEELMVRLPTTVHAVRIMVGNRQVYVSSGDRPGNRRPLPGVAQQIRLGVNQ